jgi:hypothetical protein
MRFGISASKVFGIIAITAALLQGAGPAAQAALPGDNCWPPNFGTPGAPTNVTAQPAVGGSNPSSWIPGHAWVTWTPPPRQTLTETCPKAPVLEYYVAYVDATWGGSGVMYIPAAQTIGGPSGGFADVSYATILAGHTFYFYVAARNAYGWGPTVASPPIEVH